jgi:hypothetical protein
LLIVKEVKKAGSLRIQHQKQLGLNVPEINFSKTAIYRKRLAITPWQ